MAIETHVHDGTAYRKLKYLYAHDGSNWRDIDQAYCYDGNDWRLVFQKPRWVEVGEIYNVNDVTEIGGTIYAASQDGAYSWDGSTWNRLGLIDYSHIITEIDGII